MVIQNMRLPFTLRFYIFIFLIKIMDPKKGIQKWRLFLPWITASGRPIMSYSLTTAAVQFRGSWFREL